MYVNTAVKAEKAVKFKPSKKGRIMRKVVMLLCLLAVLPGCGAIADKQHRDAVLSRELTPDVRSAIANKQIKKGMTKDEVMAAWGRPCWACYGTRSTSEGDWWEYNYWGAGSYGAGAGKYLFFGNDDILDYWSE